MTLTSDHKQGLRRNAVDDSAPSSRKVPRVKENDHQSKPSAGSGLARKSPQSPQLIRPQNQSSSFPGAIKPLKSSRSSRSKSRRRKRMRNAKSVPDCDLHSMRKITPPGPIAESLPSMTLLKQNLSRSNSSFLNSYISQHEATRTSANATFTFIQRSDTQGLKAAMKEIRSLVEEQVEADKEAQSSSSSSEASSQGEEDEGEEQLKIKSNRSNTSGQSEKEPQPDFPKTDDGIVKACTSATPNQNNIVPNSDESSYFESESSNNSYESFRQTQYEKRASLICQHLVRLHSYVQDEFYRIVLGGEGAIQVTLEAMNAFSSHEFVQAAGNLTIGGLCDRNLMNGLKLVKSGGLVSIINSVKKFPTSSRVCSMAVNCLILATAVTELAVLFLKQMKDGLKTLEDVPESLLSYESPKNRDIILGRIKMASLSNKTSTGGSLSSVPG